LAVSITVTCVNAIGFCRTVRSGCASIKVRFAMKSSSRERNTFIASPNGEPPLFAYRGLGSVNRSGKDRDKKDHTPDSNGHLLRSRGQQRPQTGRCRPSRPPPEDLHLWYAKTSFDAFSGGCNIVTFGSSQAGASFADLGMLLIATGFRPDRILAKDTGR
jgi:hypothetical protein